MTKKNNSGYSTSSVNNSSSSNSSASGSMSNSSKSSGKKQKSLEDLLKDGLLDIYSAETQLIESLPEIAKAAYSEDLQDAFEKHLQETKRHAVRLEKAFSKLGIDKNEVEKCAAMEGLLKEAKKIIEEYDESSVRDSALIIGAQKIEHYEIASYGSICELCDVLGYFQLCDLLGRTLDEEESTDKNLSEIARYVNDEAFENSRHENADMEESYSN